MRPIVNLVMMTCTTVLFSSCRTEVHKSEAWESGVLQRLATDSRDLLEPLESGEFRVEADRVTPRTSGKTAAYTLPRSMLVDLPIANANELVELLPGVSTTNIIARITDS